MLQASMICSRIRALQRPLFTRMPFKLDPEQTISKHSFRALTTKEPFYIPKYSQTRKIA
jgi:hypothetical protein